MDAAIMRFEQAVRNDMILFIPRLSLTNSRQRIIYPTMNLSKIASTCPMRS